MDNHRPPAPAVTAPPCRLLDPPGLFDYNQTRRRLVPTHRNNLSSCISACSGRISLPELHGTFLFTNLLNALNLHVQSHIDVGANSAIVSPTPILHASSPLDVVYHRIIER